MKQPSLFPELDNVPSAPSLPGQVKWRQVLNEPQYEAVTATSGPVLVIAGAGSGKTRTLVHRLAYLVEQGVDPGSILLLTFTRKAAQEMLHRASGLMAQTSQATGGTFHSVANFLLRRYGRLLGYSANFTILDRGDAEGIINLIKAGLDLRGTGKRFPAKRIIVNMISGAVNKSLEFREFLEESYGHLLIYAEDLQTICRQYHDFKRDHNMMDYDDLLVNFRDLLHDHPEARQELGQRFRYVMVDEYQDTNLIQDEIVKLLCQEHGNIMVVGDDAQSIYSFRGADFRNIMEFPKVWPQCRVIRLEENYRSVQPILAASNAIIAEAAEKFTKTLFSQIEGRERPVLFRARDEQEQARYVVEKIGRFQEEGVALADMAVLFRSGFHSYRLELELVNRQIPFEKRGGMKLTQSAHMKDVLAYLHIQINPQDRLSWSRVFLHLEKVGPKTASKIYESMRGQAEPLPVLAAYKAGKAWQQGFTKLVQALQDMALTSAPVALFDQVMDYYQPIFERIYHDDYPRRQRDLEQLRALLADYDNLQEFLDDTALDPPEEHGPGDGGDRLILSTVHSAKGLEWKKVFILNLVEGKFPSGQAQFFEEREEERRLLYVAVTRAMEHLFLLAPKMTMGQDRMMQSAMLSGFLDCLPRDLFTGPALVSEQAFVPPTRRSPAQATSKFYPPPPSDLADMEVGTLVRHNFFGQGTVQQVIPPKTVEVLFPRHGLKKLHIDYAKLELVHGL